jgi:hypothetical protein
MGQQQLLLLVLGIVIVGLAVVVGIQAFGENQKKANADALVNDGVRIASDAQAWNLKPQAFGGGNGYFTDLEFEKLGYRVAGEGDEAARCEAGEYENLNGCFALSNITANTVTITGRSHPNSGSDNQVIVAVTGTRPSDIETTVSTVSDATQ